MSLVIRGGSGLGKTTFFNSLLGFRSAPEVSINGDKHDGFDLTSLRKQIGWIPQNPQLTSGTLRDLFRLLNSEVTDAEIESLLNHVGLPLSDLPEGLETQLGGLNEKSAHLSGGQIRRISIARALFIKPSLILADEPTADLDPASAQEILTLLAKLSSDGVIVIAVLHAPDHKIIGAHEIEMVER
jgi:ABC-type transport system involved in cytochrome bd biosynthesis fused ATPase/permease subunit